MKAKIEIEVSIPKIKATKQEAKQDNASFLENSAGLGFRLFKGLSWHLGYQMEDYNPVTKERMEDRPNVKISYKFKL